MPPSDEDLSKITDYIERGWSKDNVCAVMGISQSAFKRWGKEGHAVLELNDYDIEGSLKYINDNGSLRDTDKGSLLKTTVFAYTVLRAYGNQIGRVEEAAYANAMEDGKAAIAWLERRSPKTWTRPLAPPIVVETHQIKQIIIHSGSDEPKQLEEPVSIEAEFEDV